GNPTGDRPFIRGFDSQSNVFVDGLRDVGSQTRAGCAAPVVPGITFGAGEGGNPTGDRPFIRGFDSQSNVFV
ncbi:hypothetical protein C7E17_26855, partial [Stenotrophomonas maltophilia]